MIVREERQGDAEHIRGVNLAAFETSARNSGCGRIGAPGVLPTLRFPSSRSSFASQRVRHTRGGVYGAGTSGRSIEGSVGNHSIPSGLPGLLEPISLRHVGLDVGRHVLEPTPAAVGSQLVSRSRVSGLAHGEEVQRRFYEYVRQVLRSRGRVVPSGMDLTDKQWALIGSFDGPSFSQQGHRAPLRLPAK
jgi:hypothetical protein